MSSDIIIQKNGFCCDYITFTFTRYEYSIIGAKRLSEVLEDFCGLSNGYLTIDKFDCSLRGLRGYDLSARFGNGFIICTSTDNKNLGNSVMVNISGQGLKDIGSDNLYRILIFCSKSAKFNCTRFDLAFDDFTGVLPLKQIKIAFNRFQSGFKNIDTRFTRENLVTYNGVWNNVKYTNFSFGSRGSSQYMRIYDKRAEQGAKGAFYEEFAPSYWYRFEMECRKGVARTVCDQFIDGVPLEELFQLFISRMLRFLSRNATASELNHIQRVPTADWWLKFIQSDCKGQLNHYDLDSSSTIDDMFNHIEKNYAAYLYVLRCVAPKRLEYIIDTVGRYKSRDVEKYRRIVDCPHDMEF